MPKVTIITGEKHSGKTTFLLNKIQELRKNGNEVSGILSRGTFVDGCRYSFYVQDIESKEEQLLMTTESINEVEKIGKFYIDQKAFDWGVSILKNALNSNADHIVLDEIGRFELDGKAWANILPELLSSEKQLYFVVRKEWVNTIVEKYQIKDYQIIKV